MVPAVSFLLHLTGWLMILAQTTVQLRGGEQGSALARRRCAGMPAVFLSTLAAPRAKRAVDPVATWMADQLRHVLELQGTPACVYLMSGERAAYVGSTMQRHRGAGVCNLGLPDVRFGQHLRGMLRRYVRGGLHKVQAFAREPPGMLAVFVVAAGDVPAMRAAESALIRCIMPIANTALATHGGWRCSDEAEAGPDSRSRRRQWPWQRRLLDGTSPPPTARDLIIRDLPSLVRKWGVAEAAAEQAKAARELREMHFDMAYERFRFTPAGAIAGPLELYGGASLDLLAS